jgi:hypothetical protein
MMHKPTKNLKVAIARTWKTEYTLGVLPLEFLVTKARSSDDRRMKVKILQWLVAVASVGARILFFFSK